MKYLVLIACLFNVSAMAENSIILGKLKGELSHEFSRIDADGKETKMSGKCTVAANLDLGSSEFNYDFSAWECGGMNVFNEGFNLILADNKAYWRNKDGSKGKEVGSVSADGNTVDITVAYTEDKTFTVYENTCWDTLIRRKTIPITSSFHFIFTKVSNLEYRVSREVNYQNVYAVHRALPACQNRSWTDYERAENHELAVGTLKE